MGAVLMGNSVGIGVGSLEEGDKVGAVLTGNSVGIGVSLIVGMAVGSLVGF